jgi:hypothetical protein
MREHSTTYYKSLSDYVKSDYAAGGWGFCVNQLADTEQYLDTNGIFENYYSQYNK